MELNAPQQDSRTQEQRERDIYEYTVRWDLRDDLRRFVGGEDSPIWQVIRPYFTELAGRNVPPVGPSGGDWAKDLEHACNLALVISGHFCENPDEWLRGHELTLRALQKKAREAINSTPATTGGNK